MPSLDHSLFPEKVESGEKRCTIRKKRKSPIKVGHALHHFTGPRNKSRRKLGVTVCTKTTPIVIKGNRVYLADQDLSPEEIIDLAREDGFATGSDFLAYFDLQMDPETLSFEGDVIRW